MSSITFNKLPQEKQDRVLDAAAEEFAEHGFHQASMNRVVQSIGIAKGSLFKYFGTKEGLFQSLFERSLNQIKHKLKPLAEAEGSFFDRLGAVMLAGLEFIDRHPRLYRIYLKLLFQENAPLRTQLLSTVRSSSTKFLRPLLKQGIHSGELRPDLDLETAVFLADTLLEHFLQAARVQGINATLFGLTPDQARPHIERMLDTLRQGFSAPTSSPTE
ncbi:MAG: TetR/AcrR family transcriptional regulator [Proteobacteria bacterium]|nr:TetR/AcrR family transcriptional regulator [Pseudomonadota bacterium]